ncbi:hypothetical protein GGX14DRAFT_559659 [Mycena pura]|uniref:Uncharacterized protein n=1 Tax=Mycena pura TaxID=153505 RepID=A0AAD6VX30_9AGAR|nr:hypothetical protein GGX14DRAFT_559659 [Mycena pura]
MTTTTARRLTAAVLFLPARGLCTNPEVLVWPQLTLLVFLASGPVLHFHVVSTQAFAALPWRMPRTSAMILELAVAALYRVCRGITPREGRTFLLSSRAVLIAFLFIGSGSGFRQISLLVAATGARQLFSYPLLLRRVCRYACLVLHLARPLLSSALASTGSSFSDAGDAAALCQLRLRPFFTVVKRRPRLPPTAGHAPRWIIDVSPRSSPRTRGAHAISASAQQQGPSGLMLAAGLRASEGVGAIGRIHARMEVIGVDARSFRPSYVVGTAAPSHLRDHVPRLLYVRDIIGRH